MQPFPATMAEFTPVGATARRLEQQETSQQQQHHSQQQQQHVIPDSTNLNEEYGRFQRVLRSTFDHIRAGRLVEAGRSLLEISEWLVTNARELGSYLFTNTLNTVIQAQWIHHMFSLIAPLAHADVTFELV